MTSQPCHYDVTALSLWFWNVPLFVGIQGSQPRKRRCWAEVPNEWRGRPTYTCRWLRGLETSQSQGRLESETVKHRFAYSELNSGFKVCFFLYKHLFLYRGLQHAWSILMFTSEKKNKRCDRSVVGTPQYDRWNKPKHLELIMNQIVVN